MYIKYFAAIVVQNVMNLAQLFSPTFAAFIKIFNCKNSQSLIHWWTAAAAQWECGKVLHVNNNHVHQEISLEISCNMVWTVHRCPCHCDILNTVTTSADTCHQCLPYHSLTSSTYKIFVVRNDLFTVLLSHAIHLQDGRISKAKRIFKRSASK